MPHSGIAGSHGNSTFFLRLNTLLNYFLYTFPYTEIELLFFKSAENLCNNVFPTSALARGDRWEHLTLRMLLIPYGAPAELNVDELKLAEGSGEAGAWLPLWWLSYSVSCVTLLLQRKLPADSRVLEASELVYTVSAQEYWQRELLTEEETGN